jgi:hypothetical protein
MFRAQLRSLDPNGAGTNLMASSRVLFTANETYFAGASTCESLQVTPDGGTALCATQYAFTNGVGTSSDDADCANGGLRFIAFSLPLTASGAHGRTLYQYRGACHAGESFTLWANASADSVIGFTYVNPRNYGGREATQIGVITGGRLSPLTIAKSVPRENYGSLAF